MAELRILWERGYTGSEIAEKMGYVTRNAVLGKTHRLELSYRNGGKTVRHSSTLPRGRLPRDLRTPEYSMDPADVDLVLDEIATANPTVRGRRCRRGSLVPLLRRKVTLEIKRMARGFLDCKFQKMEFDTDSFEPTDYNPILPHMRSVATPRCHTHTA
jgi:hypothetical protein